MHTYGPIRLAVVGEQNLPPQNMPLWHKGYFKLVIFKKLQTQAKPE